MMADTIRSQLFDDMEGSQYVDIYGSFQTRILSTSLTKYAPLFCIQMITSLLSVFATIVVVRISVPKLDSTYQRYIFMLNISLMANSIFLGFNPLLAPKIDEPDTTASGAFWAIGNAASCTTVGFFLVFGSLMVSMYHTAIAFYFYFSVMSIEGNYNTKSKKKVKKSDERRPATTRSESSAGSSKESSAESSTAGTTGSKSEILANMACLFIPAVFAGAAATLDSFGFNPNICLCTLYASASIEDSSWFVMQSVFRWILVTSGLCTLLITAVVRYRVGSFQKRQDKEDVPTPTRDDNKNSNASGSSLGDPDGAADDFERQIIGQKLNAISAQCLFYTVSYISSYLWFIALMFVSGTDDQSGSVPYAFLIITVTLYPLLGVFNCAIYVRPRVQMLQIMYPEDSNIAVLRVAMSKAGDPEEIEEVRAKIFGSDYSAPEDNDPVNSERSGAGENEPSPDSQIPYVVEFDQSNAVANDAVEVSAAEDGENDSVSQISDL